VTRLRFLVAASDRRRGPGAIADDLLSVSIHRGVVPRSAETDDLPRAEDLANYKVVRVGDVVLNRMRAFQGAVGRSDHDGIVSPDYTVLHPGPDVDSRYLHHLFRSHWFVGEMVSRLRGIGSTETGSVRTPRINWEDLGDIEVSSPVLPEQRAIADYLDAETARIDALIAKKQQLIHLLEERFTSGLTEIVIDHDELRGETSSEWFGPLPHGWRCARLSSLTNKILDGPHVSPRYVDEPGIPFLSVRNIGLHGWNLSTAKFISQDDFEDFNRRIQPMVGDVLLTKGGNTGIARTVDLDFPFQVWVHVAILRPALSVLPGYLTACLNSHAGYAQSQVWTRGATNQDLVLSRIAQIEIPLPPIEVQRRIVGELGRFYRADQALRSAMQRQVDLLVEHRRALVTAAVNGQPARQLAR